MSSSPGRVVPAALVFLLASTAAIAQPGAPLAALPAAVQGEAALQALGTTLPAVAAAHGKTVAEFARILRTDRTAWVDRSGRMFFVEDVPAEVRAADAAAAAPDVATATAYTATGVPILHSRPGSINVVYLDFDGHAISGTAWNSGRPDPLLALPYDLDGTPAAFSVAEQTAMERVWRRVAEDFAPFDIDVTTEPPATFTSRTGRVLITKSTDANGAAMPSSTAGGVAYVGVFGSANYLSWYSPALVYYNNLGAGREDYVAEAASHEFGHNLSLSHDGTPTTSYYSGAGSGATSWAPIMGVGYNRAVTKFNNGDYAGANNQEDDVALIGARLAWRPDDVGNTAATAAPLVQSGTEVSGAGLINSTADVDRWAFSTGAGVVTLKVTPSRIGANTDGGNLDARITIHDGNEVVVASADLGTDTTSALSLSLPAGSYTLAVAPSFATGVYTLYGGVGQYTIAGTVVATTTDVTRPTAALAAAVAPPAAGATSTSIAVTYADDVAVDVASLDGADLVVTGPGGAALSVVWAGVDDGTNGTPRTAAYALPAPGGTWDASDNGTYGIALQAAQVRDTAGNAASTGVLGTFTAAIPLPNTAPVAQLQALAPPAGSSSILSVRFSDDQGIDVASLGTGDLRVTGPTGTVYTPAFLDVDLATNGTPRTARYRLDAPGGAWDETDNGSYAIALVAGTVRDTLGLANLAAALGTLPVNLGPPQTVYATTMATNPGWTLGSTWAYGAATASNGPAGGPLVIGDTITGSGLYTDGGKTALIATTPSFATTGFTVVTLDVDAFLGVRRDDVASIQIGSGGTWTTVWSNNGSDVVDTAWTRRVIDISAAAAGRAAVQVRFVLGPTKKTGRSATVSFGWNIRGLVVTGR